MALGKYNLGRETDEKLKDKAEKGKGQGFGKDHQRAERCKNDMHDYAEMQRCAKVCKSMQRYAEICRDMQRDADTMQGW